MSARALARSVAHAQMRRAGIQHANRPRIGAKGKRAPSFFAEHWRKYAGREIKQNANRK